MFLLILTLIPCLTKAFVNDIPDTTIPRDNETEQIYNVNPWVVNLQLQHCALVAIGLKYFAIFVEDEILGRRGVKARRKYFLGICHQEVLEEWSFCTADLAKKRKYKCRFKLKDDRFHPRVHRRFCDFNVMVNNKDCGCSPTIFGDALVKVEGFPTCYIPPLPNSLCQYNVCGLNQCNPLTVEDSIHTVNCSSTCKGKDVFCEHGSQRTSELPEIHSSWSKWKTNSSSGKKVSLATCINKYTKKGGLDCLGPGTGCCPRRVANCTCETFQEKGTLKVKRTIYLPKKDHRSIRHQTLRAVNQHQHLNRYLRGTDKDGDDIEDDDDDDDGDLDEDIVLEENQENENPVPTTEDLEKEEFVEELEEEAMEELRNATSGCQKVFLSGVYLRIVLVVGSYIGI